MFKRIRITFLSSVLVLSFFSCTTLGVIKTDILPPAKQILAAAGPGLLEALVEDLMNLISRPLGWLGIEQGNNSEAGATE